jgi:hypothetical protein
MANDMKYPLTDADMADMAKRFTYHPPKPDQPERYESIRGVAFMFAMGICQNVPAGRERALAITKLEEAVMWANAGIARGEA